MSLSLKDAAIERAAQRLALQDPDVVVSWEKLPELVQDKFRGVAEGVLEAAFPDWSVELEYGVLREPTVSSAHPDYRSEFVQEMPSRSSAESAVKRGAYFADLRLVEAPVMHWRGKWESPEPKQSEKIDVWSVPCSYCGAVVGSGCQVEPRLPLPHQLAIHAERADLVVAVKRMMEAVS